MINYSVGVLAGGKSSRMGQNKALMEFNNETMIGRILKEFKGSCEVLVSAAQRGIYEADGLTVVYDEHESIGPIEGIRRVLLSASEEYVFVCAADMPFVNRDIADYIAEFVSSDYDCYVVTDGERIHPLCAIYSKKVLPVIEELISRGRYRLTDILNAVRTRQVSLKHTDFDARVVKNVNTKDEFLELLFPVEFAVSGYKNSGKTWLIEKLINEFISEGYSVGVLKHDGTDHISETAGTDTDRYRKAGACCTCVYSDTRYVLSSECDAGGGTAEQFLDMVRSSKKKTDVIILEGFKNSAYPKVEVVRREAYPESVAAPDTLICIATDTISPEEADCPVYGLDDVKGIFSCIKKHFKLDIYQKSEES